MMMTLLLQSYARPPYPHHNTILRSTRTTKPPPPPPPKFTCFSFGDAFPFTEIAHNKVLIAAAVSAAVGQLTKPFTAAVFYRRAFNDKAAFQAGGFPSTHSAAVVATATSLGLERGFSDAIFGLAVVYASLTMYDAQGVRREVGTHAKTLNRVLPRFNLSSFSSYDADSSIDSLLENSFSNSESLEPRSLEEPSTYESESSKSPLVVGSNHRMIQSSSLLISSSSAARVEHELESSPGICGPLKESVGHTEIEVIAGALLGMLVSFAVCSS